MTAKSVYTKEKGYGWRSSDGLGEFVQAYPESIFSKHYGRKVPPPIYTNEITEDMIYSKLPNAFIADVPPGRYFIYTLSGRSAGGQGDFYDFDISIGDQSSTVKIPGRRIFEKRLFSMRVEGAPLIINFKPKTAWLLSALLIYPEAERAQVERDLIAPLEQAIFLLPPEEWKKWEKIPNVDNQRIPSSTAEEKNRGYMVYSRHYLNVIYPNTIPQKEELNPTLRIFASLGEYEPTTFTVYPLRDLNECMVRGSELRGPGTIPVSNIDIRSVRYMLARPNYTTLYKYIEVPDILDPVRPMSLRKSVNQRYWVTVKVPEDAPAGMYHGELTFTSNGSSPTQIPLFVRVLPIRLKKNPDHIYSIYYRDPLSQVQDGNTREANEYFIRKGQMERRDMAEHGLEGHDSYVNFKDWNTFAVDVGDMQRRLDMDWKYGLNKRVVVLSFPEDWQDQLMARRGRGSSVGPRPESVPPEVFEDVTRMVEAIEAERKKNNWPEFLYYPIDEPSTDPDALWFTATVLKAVKKVPGVRTFVTANPARPFGPLWPYVDVWCCQPFIWDDKTIDRLSKEKNIEFWCYPNHISGNNDHTPVKGARMTWGFGFWRSGFKALIPWIYQYVAGDPFNYLDNVVMDFMNRSTADGEPIPVTLWEAYREGIDDGRYLYTLQTLIAEGKQSGSPERQHLAERADSDLKHIWDSIQVQQKYEVNGMWSGQKFDDLRWLLASHIQALQIVPEKRGVSK